MVQERVRLQSIDFQDYRCETLLYFAVAANNCYLSKPEDKIYNGCDIKVGDLLICLEKQKGKVRGGTGNTIQYGYYKIKGKIGGLNGQRIIAF